MLLPYDQYQTYGGKLEESAFMVYFYDARKKVDSFTFGRIKALTEPIGRLLTRLTDILAANDISKEKVSSWSNDGVSESYSQVSSQDVEKQMNQLIREYLANETDENGTPLLYLGVSTCD